MLLLLPPRHRPRLGKGRLGRRVGVRSGYLSAAGQGKINKMLLQKASRLTDYDRDRPSAHLCLTELPPAASLPLPLASKLLFCSFSPLRCLISHFSPLVPNKIVS